MVYCKYSIKRVRALLFLRNKPSFWINDVTNGKIIAVFYMY